MRFLPLLSLLGIVAVSSVCAEIPAEGSSGVAWRSNMHNQRYGEVVVVTGNPFHLVGHVYNTIGLNNCPEALWKTLDPAKLKKEYHAIAVLLNGPRYFMMDRISLAKPGPVASFQGLQARLLATVKIPLSALLHGQSAPYKEIPVDRTTNYIFNKGRTIYQLTAPNGRKYVMQSYSRIMNPKLSEKDLPDLGNQLKLPAGWTYTTRKLNADYTMSVTGVAHVIQDSLKNTYQLATR